MLALLGLLLHHRRRAFYFAKMEKDVTAAALLAPPTPPLHFGAPGSLPAASGGSATLLDGLPM